MVNLVDIKFLGNMMYCVNLYDVLCWLADKECLRWVIVIPMKPVWPWIIISHQMFTALTQSFKTSEADALWNHGPVMVCFLPFISCLNVLVGSIPVHPRVMYISIYVYTCMCIYIYTVYTYNHIVIYIYMCVYTYVYICVCIPTISALYAKKLLDTFGDDLEAHL